MECQRILKTSQINYQRKSKPSVKFALPASNTVHPILQVQQMIGNQAVQRLFKFSIIQAKLRVGEPGDKYEREADRVADRVMRMPVSRVPQEAGVSDKTQFPSIQRLCPECEEEMQRKPIGEDEKRKIPEAKKVAGQTVKAITDLQTRIQSLRGSGQPLPESVRGFFEPRFGHDFSRVRVHTDSQAGEAAQAVNARAFTVGRNIVFGAGQYKLHSDAGRSLLAHELTHVVQQAKEINVRSENRIRSNHRYGREAGLVSHSVTEVRRHLPRLSPAAITLQRAMICSKRLEAPVIGWFFNHAYIDDTGGNNCRGSGMPGNYAIQSLVSGNFIKGCAAKTDHSTDPQSYTPNMKPCNPKPGVTNLSKCLRVAFNRYSDPSLYKNPRGPNSNTFAFTLAKTCCVDSSSTGLGRVPGWGRPPAPPCPPKPQCRPRYLGGGAYIGRDCIIRQGPGPKI